MGQTPVRTRVGKHRENLRRAGLRPIQLWVPDSRRAGFAAQCRRQAKVVAKADLGDRELLELLDDALADLPG